jgi:hypothetical protein
VSHYHVFHPTIAASLLRCRCGATSPASQPTPTSEEAAEKIGPHVTGLRARVYEFIKARGRVTDEDIVVGLGMNPSTARPRRIELVAAGLIRDSGSVTLTKSRRRAVLWEAV